MPDQPTAPASPVPAVLDQPDAVQAPPAVVDGEVVIVMDDYPPLPRPAARRWRMTAIVVSLAAISLAIGLAAGLVVSPLLFASATITLTPESHTVATDAAVSLPVRLYPVSQGSLSQTIAATGTATRQATAARGSITFYNGLPAPQTVPAGTLLMSTNGVPVLTEQDASIPAASPPTEGSATVTAHAENTGSAGNIVAGTIAGPCCRAYVLAYNGPFWDGADARTYRTPTPGEIATAVASLRHHIDSRMQTAIHTWLRPGEVLLPPMCHAASTSSAQPGAEADHVTVTVREACSAAAYNETALQQAAAARLGARATHQVGSSYRLMNDVRTTVSGMNVSGGHVTLRLQLSGMYVYGFSERQLIRLRGHLAGVSRDRASVMLMQLAGVAHAAILSSSTTLPRDPGRIRIVVAQ